MKARLSLSHCLAAALVVPSLAFASLGGNIASIQADQVQMKATSRIASTQAKYTVHEIQTTSGTAVREYVAANGTVFGVAWNGPVVPNLRQVLGQYFVPFTQAAKTLQSGHSHLLIQQANLVVRASGHMRAFRGNAYVPSMLPQGVTTNEIL
jgi:hypothetical protein